MDIVINIVVVLLMIISAWFFLRRPEEKSVSASGVVNITVKGGYHPAALRIKKGESIVLRFNRQDASSCVEEVVIPELGIRQFLPLNTPTDIEIKPEKIGTIPFQCGMGMVHGKIEVVA